MSGIQRVEDYKLDFFAAHAPAVVPPWFAAVNKVEPTVPADRIPLSVRVYSDASAEHERTFGSPPPYNADDDTAYVRWNAAQEASRSRLNELHAACEDGRKEMTRLMQVARETAELQLLTRWRFAFAAAMMAARAEFHALTTQTAADGYDLRSPTEATR